MRKFGFVIFQTSLFVWIVNCTPRRIKNETIQTFCKRNGEPIAVCELIQKYEREFQNFHEEETKDGNVFKWPALENINLSNYCRKYLQHSVPGRTTDRATGTKLRSILSYGSENTKIIILLCNVMNKIHPLTYYLTRAPEPNCVYALKYTRTKRFYKFTIIYKHCDFEDEQILEKISRKRKIVDKMHQKTGQPIAQLKYLLEYELEHQEMLKKEGYEDICTEWSYAVEHTNLDHYCYQYIKECAPTRNREGTKGKWIIESLRYQQIYMNKYISITVVACKAPYQLYYMTRAPEINCVYALNRKGCNSYAPLVIVFKHCDFEMPNFQQTNSQNDDILDKKLSGITAEKENPIDVIETLDFFQLSN